MPTGRSYLRQDNQIQASQTYSGSLAAGSSLQANAVSVEDDLNSLRSQVSRILDATGSGNWYDPINTTNAKTRSLKQLNVGLDAIESKFALRRTTNITNIAVPASQNYVVLAYSASQTPSPAIAISSTTLGAVVAVSANSGGTFAANELATVAGVDGINPKNLCLVRDASTGQAIDAGQGLDVFALLQVESTAADGGSFNDTSASNRAKLSFVVPNFSTGTLAAASASLIAGRTIQYTFNQRTVFGSMSEQDFLGTPGFVDNVASADVTLQNAFNNQAGVAVTQTYSQAIKVGNAYTFAFQNADASRTFATMLGAASGSTSMTLSPDTLALNPTNNITSSVGVTFGVGGTAPTRVNVVAGQIDNTGSQGNLAINAIAYNLYLQSNSNVRILPAGNIQMSDLNKAGSGWSATVIPLSSASATWVSWKANFGEVGIMDGVVATYAHGNHALRFANVTAASIAAGTNVTGGGSTPNLDTQLFNYSGLASFTGGQLKVYVNGTLMRPGASSAAACDYYPGTTPANGDLMFNFSLTGTAAHTDVVTMEIHQASAYPS